MTRAVSPFLWAALAALVALPFYSSVFREQSLELVPMTWLWLGTVLLLIAPLWRLAWPLALFVAYAAVRTSMEWWPGPGGGAFVFLLVGALLYLALTKLDERSERWLEWGCLVGLTIEGLLGVVNLFGLYPTLFGPKLWFEINPAMDVAGRPMGLLRYPTLWAIYMALGLPLIWRRIHPSAAFLVLGLVLLSRSLTASGVAVIGVLLMAWPLLGRWARAMVAFGGSLLSLQALSTHGLHSSGRWDQMVAGWPMIAVHPWTGWGLGFWSQYANLHNLRLRKEHFTLQLQVEPYQLLFELGVVGLGLALVLVVWTLRDVHRALGSEAGRPWAVMAVMGLIASVGVSVFHLAAPAFLTLMGAARARAWALREGGA